jgi:YD repeat-containing protein
VTTCGSSNKQLTYDALGELLNWQNASGASEQYAYDGSGQRVWQQASSTSGSTTTTTATTYVLGVEEVTTWTAPQLTDQRLSHLRCWS